MRIRRGNLRLAGVLTVAVVTTVALYIAASRTGYEQYHAAQRILLEIHSDESQLGFSISFLTAAHELNYDQLAGLQESLATHRSELLQLADSPDTAPHGSAVNLTAALADAAAEIDNAAESFKTAHAVLRNATAGFLRHTGELSNSAISEHERFAALATEVAGLRYVNDANPASRRLLESQLAFNAEAFSGAAPPTAALLGALTQQARTILAYRPRVTAAIDAIATNPVAALVDELLELYGAQYRWSHARAAMYRQGLFVMSIALAGLVTHALLLAERRARELRDLNRTLELRVDERSRELTRVEAHARQVLQSVAEGIISVDPDGVVTFANEAVARMFAMPAATMIGSSIGEVHGQLVFEGRNPDPNELFDRVSHKDLPTRLCLAYGDVVELEYSVTPIEIDGSWQGAALIIRDVSERKAAEAKLERVNADLMQAHRLSGMAEVATEVLHNVGNVLNTVNVSASRMSDRARGLDTAGLRKAAEALGQHADTAADPVRIGTYLCALADGYEDEKRRLLDESGELLDAVEHIKSVVRSQQAHAGAAGGVCVRADARSLIEQALALVSWAQHDVRIETSFEDVPALMVDRHRAIQVIVNLLTNAKDALRDTAAANPTIEIRVYRTQRYVHFEVKDNGPGIDPKNTRRLFEYGFTTKKDGHGFGLHASVLAARELGGDLHHENTGNGTGACFRFDLPLASQEAAA